MAGLLGNISLAPSLFHHIKIHEKKNLGRVLDSRKRHRNLNHQPSKFTWHILQESNLFYLPIASSWTLFGMNTNGLGQLVFFPPFFPFLHKSITLASILFYFSEFNVFISYLKIWWYFNFIECNINGHFAFLNGSTNK